jgi:hypothetical protein
VNNLLIEAFWKKPYRKCTCHRIKPYVDLVDEVCGVADSHERTSRVNVILPSVEFFVIFERKMKSLVFCFQEKTIWFQIDAFDIHDLTQINEILLGTRLYVKWISDMDD